MTVTGGDNLANRLAVGTESAPGDLDRIFRQRLCRLVEQQMSSKYRRREDAEDVVQSVFRTFFRRTANGEFEFENEGALWGLLQTIARRKVVKHVKYHGAEKRDVGLEVDVDYDQPDGGPSAAQSRILGDALEVVLNGLGPLEPEIALRQLHGYTVAETVDIVLEGLESPYPEILQLRLQGHSQSHIAARVGCGREAVRSRMKRIEQRLTRLLSG